MNSDYKRPVNLGNPEEYSMIEFAHLVKDKIGSSSEIKFMELPQDDPKSVVQISHLARKNLVGITKIPLSEGLDENNKLVSQD